MEQPNPKPKKEMVLGELFIERLPEIFNKQAYKNGVRVIVRRNQKLEIGLPGMKVAFSHHEYLVLAEVWQMWQELGRPESGEIYRENESLSLSEFTDNLYGDERKFRTGKNYRTRVEKWIKNLLTIPILHYVLNADKNGDVKVSLGSFTFLSGAEGILRKNGRYFDLSKLKIHPTLVKSFLAHHVKPVRLDVVRSLSGDNEVVFYRELDLLLSKRDKTERELIPFCNDLGIQYTRERDYTKKAKAICRKMINQPLSSGGFIGYCAVEYKGKNQWIVAEKHATVKIVVPQAPKEKPPTRRKDGVDFEEHCALLKNRYNDFSNEGKAKVEDMKQEFLKEAAFSQSELTIESCFYKAVESVLKQEFIKDRISFNSHKTPLLTYREHTHLKNESRRDTEQERCDMTRRLWMLRLVFVVLYNAPFGRPMLSSKCHMISSIENSP